MLLQYIINVINTCVGEPFERWVRDKVEQRNASLVQENFVEMDYEVAQAFKSATQVSCTSFHFSLLS